MFKNISSGAALLGAASALPPQVHIDIDVARIEDTLQHAGAWAEATRQTPEFRQVVGSLNQVVTKTQFRILASQRAVLKPFTKNLKEYLRYLNPDPEYCDVDGFVACAINANATNFWKSLDSECSNMSTCNVEWNQLYPEEK